jgi:sialate O-acetylesterase
MNSTDTSLPPRFAPPFTNHAVLQRDQPIPVWGTCGPKQCVTVRLAENSARITAGPDGNWLVRLPPHPAGGPHEIIATTTSGETRITDVMIGEVWICSGQSNMEWKLNMTSQELSEAESNLPDIRVLTALGPARLGRQTELCGQWENATRKTLAEFSAVASWFGRNLHRELGVPIGLICNAWGGTRVQAWMSREALMLDVDGQDEVLSYERNAYRINEVDPANSPNDWNQINLTLDQHNDGLDRGWADAGFDDSGWGVMPLPSRWQEHGHPENGVFWFRRTVVLPASWRGHELEIRLGAIDKHDDTYVNGVRVGGLSWEAGEGSWCTPRTYRIPAHLVVGDEVSIAVRARSHCFHGGLIGPEADMLICLPDDPSSTVSLSGEWRYAVEQNWGVRLPPEQRLEPGSPNAPYTLFDSRLYPLIPYGIRGVIWYQGESNIFEAAKYRRMLPHMVNDWRRAFGQGPFPFIQVQLANYMAPSAQIEKSDWAALRDAQAKAISEPGIGFVVAIDCGEESDIHPRDKRTVGDRLARWALVNVYNRPGDPCGPLYAGMSVENHGRVRIRFNHASGLRTNNGLPPCHVAIAGSDRNFVMAEASIEEDTLIVWSPQVRHPAAVRYAWANNPIGCNLIGGTADLPAAPFRTDDWS